MAQTWSGWEQAVLTAGEWPVTTANVRFLQEWNSPYEESACANNPLDTTLHWKGSTNCVETQTKGVWVQAYPSHAAGAAATAATIKGPLFFAIAGALRSGDPYHYPDSATVAQQISTWGTEGYAAHYLLESGATQPGQTAPSNTPTGNASGLRGYADLRNSVARHLPTQLNYSQKAGAATLRTLAQRRKVKG